MSRYTTARKHYKTQVEAQRFCEQWNATLSAYMKKKAPAHYFYNPYIDTEGVKQDMWTCFYPHRLGTSFAA